MKKLLLLVSLFFLFGGSLLAQPEITIVSGKRDTVNVARHYLRGMTDPECTLTVNGNPFPVYNTGAFAAEVLLNEGANDVTLVARKGKTETTNTFGIFYKPQQKPVPTASFSIEEAQLIPSGTAMVSPGDVLQVRVKAFPNSMLSWLNGKPLNELPISETNGMAGIYQGQYVVKENDELLSKPISVSLIGKGQSPRKQVSEKIAVLDPNNPVFVKTLPNAFLNYGLGEDRLGGSKIGYIDQGINLQVVGKVKDMYKVQLSKNYQAWIPVSQADSVMLTGVFRPKSLSSSWRVYGDEHYDYVSINFSEKLAYRSFQETNPTRIVVDIYGATTNTAWITQMLNTSEVKNVNYEQLEDDILRVFIELNHKQHWGHSIYYEGSNLVIRVKHQPKLLIKDLVIAVDAGHGGETSFGAIGTTGLKEKDINLKLAMLLKDELEKRGAKVILTRSDDSDISMAQRLSFLREQAPDLLISMHNNAGGNPITTKGSSTYYRHIGFRPLSLAILNQVLELGVTNYGNVGSFNFALNSPTEYPNALVEVLFMSCPEDEARLLDKSFQQSLVKKIADGINHFLKNAE